MNDPKVRILKCDHSNESYRAVLSSGAVYQLPCRNRFVVLSVWMKSSGLSIKRKLSIL